MSNEELLRDHERRLFVLEITMNGTIKDGEKIDGVMDTLQRHNVYLVGDSRVNSVGIVQAVEKLTNVLKYGIGAQWMFGILYVIWKDLLHK